MLPLHVSCLMLKSVGGGESLNEQSSEEGLEDMAACGVAFAFRAYQLLYF